MTHPHVRRPGGITLLMVLGVIQGIAAIGAGIFLVADKDDADLIDKTKLSENQLVGTGIGMIVAGAVLGLLALSLGRGSNIVRWMFAILTVANVAYGAWGVFGLHGEQQIAAAWTAVFGLIILWILFGSERTDEFFGSA
jgi:hypothetical protein